MIAARSIAEALGNSYRSGQWWRCRCPVHNSTGASLALRNVGGGLQVRCFARCSSAAILAELHRRGLIDKATAAPDPEADEREREADARDRAKRIAAARWIWDETEPANWLIETYLGGRLILCPIPETIRLHRVAAPPRGGMPPAGDGRGGRARRARLRRHPLHLSGAERRGKASAIEPVKRFIGPVGGGAVRLAPAVDTIAVCEGIETGLSYMEATGTPTWAALSARGIRSLILPDHVVEVIIAADPDPVGIMAARAAARRWLAEGRQVSIARPPLGLDFNDLAREVLG